MDAESRGEFFSKLREVDPKNYVLYYEHLEYFADKHYTPWWRSLPLHSLTL